MIALQMVVLGAFFLIWSAYQPIVMDLPIGDVGYREADSRALRIHLWCAGLAALIALLPLVRPLAWAPFLYGLYTTYTTYSFFRQQTEDQFSNNPINPQIKAQLLEKMEVNWPVINLWLTGYGLQANGLLILTIWFILRVRRDLKDRREARSDLATMASG